MGSRRTMTRSFSANGRIGHNNGDDAVRITRPGGCSYLSNVRPDIRSTLCSVMAQLTEDTQPFFEETLKSRAVSSNCNVKFTCVVTGHPAPQVIWYKDDQQLDRYCGLPKYEVFHNGANHSLHIYNCTVEDAAIYQISAKNSKGIVSCSGVLEVGEMNEYKIHQRYFSKLRQKAENRRKDNQRPEDQGQLRTISPDRTLRKRRSTMESFLRTPSSLEDGGGELNRPALAAETEHRLQSKTASEAEEKPVPMVNGDVSAGTNGQVTHVYDPAFNVSKVPKPKSPLVKKKIKISSGAKAVRAPEERRTEISTSATAVQAGKNVEEVMEVECNVNITLAVSGQHNGSSTPIVDKALQDENKQVKVNVRSTRGKPVAPAPPAAPPSAYQAPSRAKDKSAGKHVNEIKSQDKKEHLETPNQSNSSPKQKRPPPTPPRPSRRNIARKGDAGSVQASLPQNTPLEKEAKHLDVSQNDRVCVDTLPVLQAEPQTEVTRTRTTTDRNDTPVKPEPPLVPPRKIDVQPPQKTPSESETTIDDIQTPVSHRAVQPAADKMTQDIQDHSTGSNGGHMLLLTDLQKSLLGSSGDGEKIQGSKVSPIIQESQDKRAAGVADDTHVQTVEVLDLDIDEKVNGKPGGQALGEADGFGAHETADKMETDIVTQPMVGNVEEEQTRTSAQEDTVVTTVNDDADPKTKESKEEVAVEMIECRPEIIDGTAGPGDKVPDDTHSEVQNIKPANFETPILKTVENKITNSTDSPEHQIKGYTEIPSPVAKVISIAELLRAQILALESTAATPEFTKAGKDKAESSDAPPPPPTSMKATLLEVFNQLNQTVLEQMQVLVRTSPNIEDLHKSDEVPPVPVADDPPVQTTATVSNVQSDDVSIMDTGQDSGMQTLENIKEISDSGDVNISDVSPSPPTEEMTSAPTAVAEQLVSVSQENGSQLTDVVIEKDTAPSPAPEQSCQQPIITSVERSDMDSVQVKDDNGYIENAATIQPAVQHSPAAEEEAPKLDTNGAGEDIGGMNPPVVETGTSAVEDSKKTDDLTCHNIEASPLLKRRNISPIPSATPQELASGARRKIPLPKLEAEETPEPVPSETRQTEKKEASLLKRPVSPAALPMPQVSPSPALLHPGGEAERPKQTERRSPLSSRRRMPPEVPAPSHQPTEEICMPKTEEKAAEKDKHDPFKAPQVIRKIRGESFSDASGHLKLWCQFFNVLSDCTIKWSRDEVEIAHLRRNAADETPVNLAVVQASPLDCGVYGCTITNEYGTDTTDFLLSAEILAGMSLREDLGVGEEIEMMPLMFSKGVADPGVWGNKFFGRVMVQESRLGKGCSQKIWRAKVIYGLEPVFDSGNMCFVKVRGPIAYGGKGESQLIEKNMDITKQQCRCQNMAREYCKIFSAEARVIENFGPSLEVIPVHLMYRPANTVPYATVEAELEGTYLDYSRLDHTGKLVMRSGTVMEQKCCTLQHWIFQWTNGNLLFTQLSGVDNKLTSVGISVRTAGYQSLSVEGNPKVFELFVSQHQCNYFCGLLALRSLKHMDSLLTPTKSKGSRSPLLQRKQSAGSSSPQSARKASGSPRLPRKVEQDSSKSPSAQNGADPPKEEDKTGQNRCL